MSFAKRDFYKQKLLLRTVKSGSCLLWTGSKDSWGYGSMRFNGPTKKTHRISYELFKGPIPKGMLVCHTCDTPACVNPEHLFLGTDKDNVDDMYKKGRQKLLRGVSHGMTSLTEEQVREIRSKYVKGTSRQNQGYSTVRLGKEYGVDHKTIHNIVNRKTWAHI